MPRTGETPRGRIKAGGYRREASARRTISSTAASSPPTRRPMRAVSPGAEPGWPPVRSISRSRASASSLGWSSSSKSATFSTPMQTPETTSVFSSHDSPGGRRQPMLPSPPQCPGGKLEVGGIIASWRKADATPGTPSKEWQQPPARKHGLAPDLSTRFISSIGVDVFPVMSKRSRRTVNWPRRGTQKRTDPRGKAAGGSVQPPGKATTDTSYLAPRAATARSGRGASSHHASLRPRSPRSASAHAARSSARTQSP
mmetsp:Transcript_7462/g.22078  ORF Transcript_7462/g.22078 Transcript_7462/m.22078 type:complete len:256 (-) Transcript_7462:546-1313(-)